MKNKSWKTTAAGVLAGIGILIPQILNVLDESPETVFDFKVAIAALGAMGIGWFSRDNDKSSESVSAK